MLPGKIRLQNDSADPSDRQPSELHGKSTKSDLYHRRLYNEKHVVSRSVSALRNCQLKWAILLCIVFVTGLHRWPIHSHVPGTLSSHTEKPPVQSIGTDLATGEPHEPRRPLTHLGLAADAPFDDVGSTDPNQLRQDLETFIASYFPIEDSRSDDPESLVNILHTFLPPPPARHTLPFIVNFFARSWQALQHHLVARTSTTTDKLVQPVIPKIVYQKGPDNGIRPVENFATQSWQELNPQYDIQYFDDARALGYMESSFNESLLREDINREGVAAVFRRMNTVRVMQSDYLRYALLAKQGGIYADLDTRCLKPIEHWHETATTLQQSAPSGQEEDESTHLRPTMIVGIELDAASREHGEPWVLGLHGWPAPLSIVQWTFAGARGHPIFIDALRRGVQGVNSRWPAPAPLPQDVSCLEILQTTGPMILTNSVLRYLGAKYNVTWPDLVDVPPEGLLFGNVDMPADVLVLSLSAFNPGTAFFGSKDINDKTAMVQHLYAGSWRHGRPA